MKPMTHTERIKAVLEGKPTDRIPFACWGPHMNLVDRNEKDFTQAVIAYQTLYDFDVLKLMSNGLYNIEDFGLEFALPQHSDDAGYRLALRAPINSIEDMVNFKRTNPLEGTLGREVRVVRNLHEHFGESVPILPTIFGPGRTFNGMVSTSHGSFIEDLGYKSSKEFIMDNEEVYFNFMDELTEHIIALCMAYIDVGAAGFFYCPAGDTFRPDTNGYNSDTFDSVGYYKYLRPYDDKVLSAIKNKTWFNMAHIHGSANLRLKEISSLDVHALNWEDQFPMTQSLAEVRAMTDKILMGGLDRTTDFQGPSREKSKAVIRMKCEEAIKQAGQKLIIAGGCECDRETNWRFPVLKEVIEEMAAGK